MVLEDQTLASSHALSVNIETIEEIQLHVGCVYELIIAGRGQDDSIHLNHPDAERFIRELNDGDKILVIQSGKRIKAIYGPLQEDRLYPPNK